MDPIHGFINISEYPSIEKIVNSRYFQRLRRISQLGLTHTVYPSATHTRFSHSLGVMHVFLTLFDSLYKKNTEIGNNEKDMLRQLGSVACLLHDLGHGPFSHLSESIFCNGKFNHLKMSCEIIKGPEISDILTTHISPDAPKIIISLLKGEQVSGDYSLISQLISSQLDADRLDYLIRDSYFTGVNYGSVDISRISKTLAIWNKDTQFKGSAIIRQKGVSAIEDYIMGRYLMYKKVYYHKTVRCMEKLVEIAFKYAINEKLFKPPHSKGDFFQDEKFLEFDDNSLLSQLKKWTTHDNVTLKDLSKRIIERNPLKSMELSVTNMHNKNKMIEESFKKSLTEKGYSPDHYYFNDSLSISSYKPYNPLQGDDEKSVTNQIMVEDNEQLIEISEKSKIIEALSNNAESSIFYFFPKEFYNGFAEMFKMK
ncbi:MAG: HD domain-containing protein [Candidatus Nitrosocosmicus sp.]